MLSNLTEKLQNAHSTATASFAEIIISQPSIWSAFEVWLRKNPEKIFYTFYNEDKDIVRLSYSDFSEKVNNISVLFEGLGLKKGDRVATCGYNHPDLILTYFACWKTGLCVVPLNMGEDDNRLEYILENAEPKCVVVLDSEIPRISKLNAQPVIIRQNELHRIKEAQSLPKGQINYLLNDALLIYTSGTTGNPKGVILSQYNLLADAKSIKEWFQINENDAMLCVLPIHHVNGTVVTHVTPVLAGATIVMQKKFNVNNFFEIIKKEQITISSVVPTLLQFLSQSEKNKEDSISRLRFLICGAGPLTIEVVLKFEQKFNIQVMHGYGLSETTCYSCFLPMDLTVEKHKYWLSEFGYPSIGVAVASNEMGIQNDLGEVLPEGEKGEIVIRGHNVMREYFDNPKANETAFEFGWFRSGDEGFYRYDENGRKFFFITGRFKELIIRGGINLSPLEIDEIINRCPGVRTGISVGFENDWYGEEVGALIVRSDELLTEEKVVEFCKVHLPFMKQPKAVLFADSLPVTTTGKYQRNKVRHLFKDWQQVQFKPK